MIALLLSLFALGFGYYVLLKSTEETGLLKKLGNGIGYLMIVVSLCVLVGSGYACYKLCKTGNCPWISAAGSKLP